jgi:hypothetical protein
MCSACQVTLRLTAESSLRLVKTVNTSLKFKIATGTTETVRENLKTKSTQSVGGGRTPGNISVCFISLQGCTCLFGNMGFGAVDATLCLLHTNDLVASSRCYGLQCFGSRGASALAPVKSITVARPLYLRWRSIVRSLVDRNSIAQGSSDR